MQQDLPEALALRRGLEEIAVALLRVHRADQIMAAQEAQQLLQRFTIERQARLAVCSLQHLLRITQ